MSHTAEIKKCTTFIFVEGPGKQLVANGTGFFVGVPVERRPDQITSYLVSAKHVLTDSAGGWLSTIYIRLNTLDGKSIFEKIELSKVPLLTHVDPTVDLVAIPCLPDQSVHDFKLIQRDIWATKDRMAENDVSEGDDVMFAGLFTSHVGQQRNQPIFRFGKVALLSDEKISWPEEGKPPQMLDLYLLECQSFGGNSGSPVFFSLSPTRTPGMISIGGPTILLAGVMRGSFLSGNVVRKLAAADQYVSLENLGIAAVTPAFLLDELLTDPAKRVATQP